ncbi:MAG: hypothetical protein ACFFAX_14240 [Promethearchaeota archaeon]
MEIDALSGGAIRLTPLLELPIFHASILGLTLPLLALCLFVLVIPWLRKENGSGVRRYLSYLVTPPRIGSLRNESSDTALWKEIKVRLFFVYLGVALFLISFMICEFYEVFMDTLLPVTQGSTGESRIVTSVVFQNPFTAGWVGSMPWYGGLPAPSALGTYHETWSWIFITDAYTDNPLFFETVLTSLLVLSFIIGLVFLAPLGIRTIRHSFVSSMFFLLTGMMVFSKAAFGCFAQAWVLLYNDASITYGVLSATRSMFPSLADAISFGAPIILAMFALFIVIGNKLWKMYYDDSGSRTWFLVFITMSYWIGLALTILVV